MTFDPDRSGDPLADRRAAYAQDYARGGDHAAAAELMEQALERAPGWTAGRARLASFQTAAGQREKAVATLRQVLAEDPPGRYGAALALASLGEARVPAIAPTAYVEALFDTYAARFERSLVDKLGYRAPDLLVEELEKVRSPLRFTAALDLGCGTGLMGERLRALVQRLDGLDLSAEMLAKARAKALYDSLTLGDLLNETLEWPAAYDLVTAADVLIYVGDLAPVLRSVRRRLARDGLFAFTVETCEPTQAFALRPSLRYAHGSERLRSSLEAAGFRVERERPIVVRQDGGEDVAGLAVIAAVQA